MAVQHASRTCPRCGYGLVTCVGPVGATQLNGACPACKMPMVIDVSTGAAGVPVDNEPHVIAAVEPPAVPLPETVYQPLVQPKPPAEPIAEQGPVLRSVPGPSLMMPAPPVE